MFCKFSVYKSSTSFVKLFLSFFDVVIHEILLILISNCPHCPFNMCLVWGVFLLLWYEGFPGGSLVNNLPTNAGDTGSTPGWGGSPGEGNSNPLQYSYLEKPIDRGDWWDTVCRVTKSQTRLKWLSRLAGIYIKIHKRIVCSVMSNSVWPHGL